jgi:hypothetical protein
MNHLIPHFGGNACLPVPGRFIPQPYPTFNPSIIFLIQEAPAGCRPGWTILSVTGHSIY